MKVSPSQQVMLKVRILEVDRNAGRDLGISWFGKTNSVSFATGLGSQPTTATNTSGVVPWGRLHGVIVRRAARQHRQHPWRQHRRALDRARGQGARQKFLGGTGSVGAFGRKSDVSRRWRDSRAGGARHERDQHHAFWNRRQLHAEHFHRMEAIRRRSGIHPHGPPQRHHQSAAQSVRDRDQHGQQPEHQWNDSALIDRAQGAYRSRTAGRAKLRNRWPPPGSGFSKASVSFHGSATCPFSARSSDPPTSRRARPTSSSSSLRISSDLCRQGGVWRPRSIQRFSRMTSTCF